MHDGTAIAIQNAAQVVERATHVDVGNIDVPVLVRLRRLFETGALARGLVLPPREQSGSLQHPPNTGRTYGHNIRIQHHERQSPIAFQRILEMETEDGFFFPRLQPEIARNPTVVFIDTSVALSPVVELAGPHPQPVGESSGADLGLLRPAPDEIHHLVPHIVRHPHFRQSSPRLFFKAMCSAINSARTSSLVCTFFSKNSIRFCFSSTSRAGRSFDWKAEAPFSKNSFCQR